MKSILLVLTVLSMQFPVRSQDTLTIQEFRQTGK